MFVSAPFGPFGRELAQELRRRGARALRVVANGGDALDWGWGDALPYFGSDAGWKSWISRAALHNRISDVVTYGDSSPQASEALEAAERLGLRTLVLEQGYFRPDWVTLERGGVNANSRLPRIATWYRDHPAAARSPAVQAVGRAGPAAIARILSYHIAAYLAAPVFPRFRAHYKYPAIHQAAGHMARFAMQQIARRRHRRDFKRVMASPGPVFLCALQRPGDSQLWRHSDFASPPAFVDHVVSSFAAAAPKQAQLIVRPHPLDPGLIPHAANVTEAARRGGVTERVSFVDYGQLHEMLARMAGVICVNSTAGLAALEFGRPTITLGRAVYDMPGLTHQGRLDDFWTAPQAPDPDLYDTFWRVVIAETQVNGGFATARGRRLAVQEMATRMLAQTDPPSH